MDYGDLEMEKADVCGDLNRMMYAKRNPGSRSIPPRWCIEANGNGLVTRYVQPLTIVSMGPVLIKRTGEIR